MKPRDIFHVLNHVKPKTLIEKLLGVTFLFSDAISIKKADIQSSQKPFKERITNENKNY